MKGVTSMSDWRITPECMQTALQSSKLAAARLEEHLLRLVQQVDHVLRLEQRELLLVAQLLRERQLRLLARAAHRGDAERHREREALNRRAVVRLQADGAERWRARRDGERAVLARAGGRCRPRRRASVDWLRQTSWAGHRRSGSGISGCAASMKTRSTSPTSSTKRSCDDDSPARFDTLRSDAAMSEPLAVFDTSSLRPSASARPREEKNPDARDERGVMLPSDVLRITHEALPRCDMERSAPRSRPARSSSPASSSSRRPTAAQVEPVAGYCRPTTARRRARRARPSPPGARAGPAGWTRWPPPPSPSSSESSAMTRSEPSD